jgi:ribonuclease-3
MRGGRLCWQYRQCYGKSGLAKGEELMAAENESIYEQGINTLVKTLKFKKKDVPILIQALTHPAYYEGARKEGEGDNQRLEFLGDAVLNLLVGYFLYTYYPDAQEGDLTKMRAATVREAFLAKMAVDLGIDMALRLGKGSEVGGDRKRPSVLADAFEAVVGAVFVAKGFGATSDFVKKYFGDVLRTLSKDDYEDKKSLLQEMVQKTLGGNVSYRLIGSSGPDHAKTFLSGAYYNKTLLGCGSGNSKKESEQEAANDALYNKDNWLNTNEKSDSPPFAETETDDGKARRKTKNGR